jgi:hypothetical protein
MDAKTFKKLKDSYDKEVLNDPVDEPVYPSGGSNPVQYDIPKDAVTLQDLIEYRDMNFAIGNIFKAVYRIGKCDHSDKQRDLNKIIWFAQRELNKL